MQNEMQNTMQNECKNNRFSSIFKCFLESTKTTKKATYKGFYFLRCRLLFFVYVSRGLIIALIHQSFYLFHAETVQKHSFFLIHLYSFIFFLL